MGQALPLKRGASHQAFGGIVFNRSGLILMCSEEPQPGLQQWHLPVATPLPSESPATTALRSLQHLTDMSVRIVGKLPSSFEYSNAVADYFLMTPTTDASSIVAPHLRWVLPDEAIAEVDAQSKDLARPDWQAIQQLYQLKHQIFRLLGL